MNKKDDIKEQFRLKLYDYEAPVPDNEWNRRGIARQSNAEARCPTAMDGCCSGNCCFDSG